MTSQTWNWKIAPGGEKEEFEVMPGSEMGQVGVQGRAEGLADLLSLIARLGTQVLQNRYDAIV